MVHFLKLNLTSTKVRRNCAACINLIPMSKLTLSADHFQKDNTLCKTVSKIYFLKN